MSVPSLEERVRAYVASHALLPFGAPVLLAVSGGVDSMVLLHVLRALGYATHVAHLDHATRAGESTRDAAFVVEHCTDLGAPCVLGHWRDWETTSATNGSFEMEARVRRYAFLADAARRTGCTCVATGHHRDDQAETVLLRLLRGAGPGGLAGIRPRRTLAVGIDLVRPLLDCPRAALADFAREHAIPWREDASNADHAYARNRIRHETLPLLARDYDANVSARLAQTAEIIGVEDALLIELAADAARKIVADDRVQRAGFARQHPALQRRVLLGWLYSNGVTLDHAHTLAAVEFIVHAPSGKRHSLGGTHLLHAAHDEVILVDMTRVPSALPVALPLPGRCQFLGKNFSASHSELLSESPKSWCSPTRQIFDADRIAGSLSVRTRAPGDLFLPLGQAAPQKLQDYLVNRHVPQPDRDALPLLLVGDTIAWVVGHAPSAQFAVTETTRRTVLVEISPCV